MYMIQICNVYQQMKMNAHQLTETDSVRLLVHVLILMVDLPATVLLDMNTGLQDVKVSLRLQL